MAWILTQHRVTSSLKPIYALGDAALSKSKLVMMRMERRLTQAQICDLPKSNIQANP